MSQITQPKQQASVVPLLNNSLVNDFAKQYNVEPQAMIDTIKATCFKVKANEPQPSNEQLLMFMMVANQYKLNPFLREIYAFPKDGGIQPIVGVDGWAKIINGSDVVDGIDFKYGEEIEKLTDKGEKTGLFFFAWVECLIYRKGWSKPLTVREDFKECVRATEPWRQMPKRMLRHKALMQCARIALGLTGIQDEDEAVTVIPATVSDPEPIPTGRIKPVKQERPFEMLEQKASEEAKTATFVSSSQQKETVDRVSDTVQRRVTVPEEHKEPQVVQEAPGKDATLAEPPGWVNDRLDNIDGCSKANKLEMLGRTFITEYKNASDPNKSEWFPLILRAWAEKMGTITPAADVPRMAATIDSWRTHVGAIFITVKDAFDKGVREVAK